MGSTLIRNIGFLVQAFENTPSLCKGKAMNMLNVRENAWVLIENGKILDFGTMDTCPENAGSIIDATGKAVLPTWCDPHTHIVFHGSREQEFVYKLQNMTYEEIAKNGGGILNSAKKLQSASEDELFVAAEARVREMIAFGTGAIEIKSGYGLTFEDEIKMLRVIKRLKEEMPVTIKATLLGAHALPIEFRENRDEFVRIVTEQMIPYAADNGLADYFDVFCDKGFFTVEETDKMLTAADKYGLKSKIHANELDFSGGIQVGVKHNALSVDHLEFTGDDEINTLLKSNTIPTLLPSTAFYLNLHFPPARRMIDAGLPIALATDYNPGSSPSGNMSFILSLACLKMKMLPNEVLNAATINAAFAMEVQNTHGAIVKGQPANVSITQKIPSLAYLPYRFGSNLIEQVILNKA